MAKSETLTFTETVLKCYHLYISPCTRRVINVRCVVHLNERRLANSRFLPSPLVVLVLLMSRQCLESRF